LLRGSLRHSFQQCRGSDYGELFIRKTSRKKKEKKQAEENWSSMTKPLHFCPSPPQKICHPQENLYFETGNMSTLLLKKIETQVQRTFLHRENFIPFEDAFWRQPQGQPLPRQNRYRQELFPP
jgi:hypothetical protein